MCGIIGQFNKERPILQSEVECMHHGLGKLAYRGPDGMGSWKSDKVLLGHRRLSIIDLSSAGSQPFIDKDRGLIITFNGEIYNFQKIREELVLKGHTFLSQSDTEVILHAYDQYGIDFLSRLRGMFAFCLFDQKKNIAILARDPAGEKPLYYYLDSKSLFFSSEIKVFHAFPEVDLSMDIESVKAFFALQYVPGPHTVYRQVKKLPAGSVLVFNLDTWDARLTQYWSIENQQASTSTPAQVEEALFESVRYRLIADVEVGLLLSGGIDSALLALYARQAGANLRVFTARFDEENLDESNYAKYVADHLNLQQIVISGGQLTPETFDEVIFHGDELLGDPACIPTFLLAREISKHVKVVLSGEGADELFWGYDTYRLERLWRWFSWLKKSFTRIPGFQQLVSDWDVSNKIPAGLTRLGKIFSARYDIGAARWTSVFAEQSIRNLIPVTGNSDKDVYLQEIEQRIAQLGHHMDSFSSALTADLLYWLPDDLLMKVDRMTMAHSVEARAPFLDSELILKALALPSKYKIQGKTGKYLLRKLVEKHFHDAEGRKLAWRKKHGFEVPMNSWLRNSMRESVEDRLSSAKLAKSGFFDVAFATKLKRNFYASPEDTSLKRKLWMLLCFQTWYEMHETGFGFR